MFLLCRDLNTQEKINEVISEFRDEFLVKSGGYSLPTIGFDSIYRNEQLQMKAVLTIAMPVCNQEEIIASILNTLFQSLSLASRIILVLDACSDGSELEVKNFLMHRSGESEKVVEVTILKTSEDLFEASCEAICLKLTTTNYFVSLQSDIYMNDSTFFERAIIAMSRHPDIAGISGKAVVSFFPRSLVPPKIGILRFIINFPTRIAGRGPLFLGRFGSHHIYFGDVSRPLASYMYFSKRSQKTVFLGHSIIRGPIIWKTSSLVEIGGINHLSYFLGWDDYDVSYRLWKVLRQRVGYLPSKSYSIPNTGTNSKPRTNLADYLYSERSNLGKRIPGELDNLWETLGEDSPETLPPYEKRKF